MEQTCISSKAALYPLPNGFNRAGTILGCSRCSTGHLELTDKCCSPNNWLCKSHKKHKFFSAVCGLYWVQQSHFYFTNLFAIKIVCCTTMYIFFCFNYHSRSHSLLHTYFPRVVWGVPHCLSRTREHSEHKDKCCSPNNKIG